MTTAPGSRAHRKRLQPILDQLEVAGESVFLDLCELLLMVSERVEGSLEWSHSRVLVRIQRRKKANSTIVSAKALRSEKA